MIFMCFSCCMCFLTILAALLMLPTERFQPDRATTAHESNPRASSTLLRIMQLKTRDDDETRLDFPMLQTLFPEWRTTAAVGSVKNEAKNGSHFDVDRVLSDLIIAVRELARRNLS